MCASQLFDLLLQLQGQQDLSCFADHRLQTCHMSAVEGQRAKEVQII